MEALKTAKTCARTDHKSAKAAKKNCGANCLCVYGLGEQIKNAANPVWGEVKGLLEVLGADPNDNERTVDVPAGLRNLGATCYLGSLVQVLFHNAAFRDALYRTPMREDWDEAPDVVSALQEIFADLEVGGRVSCDVNNLTDLLGLEVSVQQDPQEFGKLFMAKVEECVGDETFVRDIFRGEQAYETTCSECGNKTERAADFDELEVALRGQCSVGDCVRCHFQPEALEGDNQYHCEVCAGKVDAERRLKILKAPPVLQVQLLRYVYDRVTWEKKKLRDAIETTASIVIDEAGTSVDYDLCALVLHRGESAHGGHYVARCKDWRSNKWHQFDDDSVTAFSAPDEFLGDKKKKPPKSSESYMLAYVRRQWFEERQGSTQPPPKKRRGRAAAAPARQPEPAAEPPTLAKNAVVKLNEEHDLEKVTWTSGKEVLEASVRERREKYERLFGGADAATPAYSAFDGVVPEFAGDVALLETDALEAWVAGVAPKGAAKTGAADADGVVNMTGDDSDDDDATAVVQAGGVVWADAEVGRLPRVARLVRAPRLCAHGCLRPAELKHFKVLRRDVYDAVVADLFGDEPPNVDTGLTGQLGFCVACATAGAEERSKATEIYEQRRKLLARLQASAASVAATGTRVVAKQFLAELKKMGVPTMANNGRDIWEDSGVDCNEKIKCPHDLLKPRCNPKPLRIDEALWNEITKLFCNCTELVWDAPACEVCAGTQEERKEQQQQRHGELDACPALGALLERAALAQKRRGSSTRGQPGPPSVDDASAAFGVLAPAAPTDAARPRTARAWIAAADDSDLPAFRLVPRFWLARWRAYHRLNGPRPGAFGDAASMLTCACGATAPDARRLRQAPLWLDRLLRLAGAGAPDATRRRGDDAAAVAEAMEAAQTTDDVVYDCVRENPDASAASTALDGLEEAYRGRDAPYEAVSAAEYAGLCAHYEDATPGSALRVYADPDGWRVGEQACDQCARRAAEAHCVNRDEYDEAPIRVCKLGATDSPPAADMLDDAFDDELAVTVENGDARRRSRRSSRTPTARTFETVKLGSDDRVGLLLLKLCEAFPEMMDGGKKRKNAAAKAILLLTRGGDALEAHSTLQQAGVRARDALYARIVEVTDEVPGAATLDDLVFYAADAKAPPHQGKRGKTEREAETGFAGTLLGGGGPSREEEPSQEV